MLMGCETDFHPKTDTKPVLCLNSLITAGEPIEINVTHTWVYTDEYAAKNHSVEDAEIQIFANGIEVDQDFRPKEGDRIRIEASSRAYGYAEAEVTVPYAAVPADLDYSVKVTSTYAEELTDRGLTARIEFDINASTEITADRKAYSYYRIGSEPFPKENTSREYIDSWWPEEYPKDPYQTVSKGMFRPVDPILREYVSDFEEILGYSGVGDENAFFSDRGFEGLSRRIYFRFEGCGYSVSGLKAGEPVINCGYDVTLYTISESYFNWAMYYWQWGDGLIGEFADMGLADPIWGYSNVSTGAGVVAAQSSRTLTIDLRDFLEKALEEAVH